MATEATQKVPERLLGQDFGLEALGRIRAIVAEPLATNRARIARRACEVMGWVTAAGVPRLMSARAGLLSLHRAGLIQLPAPTHAHSNNRPRVLSTELEFSTAHGAVLVKEEPLVGRIDQLGAFWLRPVQGAGESALYYTLLERYHYLGAKSGGSPHLLRYVFGLEDRLLGVIGFGPAALKVRVRDRFVGWRSTEERRGGLHRIVNNLRFLILPWVRCANLASKVLARCGRQLPQDFAARYGFEPVLLESFVERERFKGGSYRAANWVCVGQTCGRGKRDRFHRGKVAIKDVWLYRLRADWRQQLQALSSD
jgi:hypothetical protein